MEYFNGNQAEENASYEANAPYDYVREVNAGMEDTFAGDEDYSDEDYIEVSIAQGMTREEAEASLAACNAAPAPTFDEIPF